MNDEADSEFADLPNAPESASRQVYVRPTRVHDFWSRVPLVVGVLACIVFLTSIAIEYRFWLLKMAGRSVTGVVHTREEHIIGWGGRGRPFPITETRFTIAFEGENGDVVRAIVSVPWSSHAFRPGEHVDLMYLESSPQQARPASWGFYADHDSMWMTAAISGSISSIVAIVCLIWHRTANRTPTASAA